MCADSEGSCETVRMRRLALAFAGRLCLSVPYLMSWHIYVYFHFTLENKIHIHDKNFNILYLCHRRTTNAQPQPVWSERLCYLLLDIIRILADVRSDCISSWSLLIFLLCYIKKTLVGFCTWADRFESYIVYGLDIFNTLIRMGYTRGDQKVSALMLQLFNDIRYRN